MGMGCNPEHTSIDVFAHCRDRRSVDICVRRTSAQMRSTSTVCRARGWRAAPQRGLRTSLSAICVAMAALLSADGAAAQSAGAPRGKPSTGLSNAGDPQVFGTRRQRSTGSFWTPERMRDAEPRDLPSVTPDQVGPAYLPESTAGAGDSRSQPGVAPGIDVPPDFDNQLFEPHEPELVPELDPAFQFEAPLSASPDGALFTNSRVFPREALTAYPYRAAGKLFYHDPVQNVDFVCSGSVIQRRLVVTAGHCVYDAEQGYAYTNFRFVPGYDEGVAPFGAWDAEQALTTLSWAEGGGRVPNAGDFAILVITDQFVEGTGVAIGQLVGWLGWQTEVVANSHVTMLGYPGNLDSGQRMQQTAAQTFALVEPNAAEFGSAQGGGSSGGPYVLNFGELAEGQDEPVQNRVVGIMSYGYSDLATGQPLGQAGTSIINGEFVALLEAACQAGPDNCL